MPRRIPSEVNDSVARHQYQRPQGLMIRWCRRRTGPGPGVGFPKLRSRCIADSAAICLNRTRRTATGVDPMRLLLSLLASLTFLSALAPSAPAQQGETLRIGIARRSGHPRSDVLAHLCRHRRDDGAVRQAVRLRCEAEHRAGAGYRLRMGGRQDAADQAAHRGAVPQRRKIRRRCGEIFAWSATSTPTAASAAARSVRWTMSRWSIRRPCGW